MRRHRPPAHISVGCLVRGERPAALPPWFSCSARDLSLSINVRTGGLFRFRAKRLLRMHRFVFSREITEAPNQAMLRTEIAHVDFMSICHSPVHCADRCSGLAVADSCVSLDVEKPLRIALLS